ncbi:MAG: Rpn family recombination-promoting nuclease/putative transposase, partial [Halothiobacillaceae bacterium]
HDEVSFLNEARREGLREGMEQGIQQGMEQGIQQGSVHARRENARNLIRLGVLTDVQIAEAIGLPLDEVRALHSDGE